MTSSFSIVIPPSYLSKSLTAIMINISVYIFHELKNRYRYAQQDKAACVFLWLYRRCLLLFSLRDSEGGTG